MAKCANSICPSRRQSICVGSLGHGLEPDTKSHSDEKKRFLKF